MKSNTATCNVSEASVSRGGSDVARYDTTNLIKHLEQSHVKVGKKCNPNHILAFNCSYNCSCPHNTHTTSSSCTFNSEPDAAIFVAASAPNFGVQREGMRFRKRPLFTFVQNTVTHGYVTHLLLGQKLPENHAGVHTAKCDWMHVKCILHFMYYYWGILNIFLAC